MEIKEKIEGYHNRLANHKIQTTKTQNSKINYLLRRNGSDWWLLEQNNSASEITYPSVHEYTSVYSRGTF